MKSDDDTYFEEDIKSDSKYWIPKKDKKEVNKG